MAEFAVAAASAAISGEAGAIYRVACFADKSAPTRVAAPAPI